MRLRLSAKLDNAAFHYGDDRLDPDDYPLGDLDADAVATLLVAAAKAIHEGQREGTLRDVNGNRVGEWSVR